MAGIGSSLISLLAIWLAFPTWGLIVYPKLLTFPDWAYNMTLAAKAIKVASVALPANSTIGLVANATNAIVNGTLH